jgi:membrane-associated phospholipid phosphatase
MLDPRIVGGVALAGLAALVLSLEHWIVVDDAVWRFVLYARGCDTDGRVDRVVDLATHVLTAIVVFVAAGHAYRHGARAAWPWVVVSLLGLLTSKTLKHVFTRERPSALPDLAHGFSFPSAHVMNSLVAVIAVTALTQHARGRAWWRVAAVVLTLIVTAGRVLLGRHWASDVLGGSLAALALVGLVVPTIRRRPIVAPIVFAVALAVGFVVDRRLGRDGVHLPTPLVGARVAMLDVDVPAPDRDRSVGRVAWLDGAATIPFDVPADVDVTRPLELAVGGRSERALASCLSLAFTVNGAEVGRFVAFRGWREYRVVLPPGTLRLGANTFTLSAVTDDGSVRWALVYVRLVDRARR